MASLRSPRLRRTATTKAAPRTGASNWFHSEGCPMRAILLLFATLALPVAAAAPIAIPLREGLTLDSTVSRPAGNINTELKITAINARTVMLSFTAKNRGCRLRTSQRILRLQGADTRCVGKERVIECIY